MPGRCPKCGSGILKRKSQRGYAYYACEKGKDCGFMTWDVPTAEDCPYCGQTLFKKSGKGQKKTFCINEQCENFTPEDQRPGYRKKKETAAEDAADKKTVKKTATAKKSSSAKKTAKKTTTSKKAAKKAAGSES